MTSVIIPIAYLVVIFGGLYAFSVLYKRHIAGKSTYVILAYVSRLGSDTFQLSHLQERVSTHTTSHIRNEMPTSPFYSRILQHRKSH
jgi:hypothetical protein